MKPRIGLLMIIGLLAGLHPVAAQVSFAPAANYRVDKGPNCVVAMDVNNDGKLDLICANSGIDFGNTITVLTNNGAGIFASNTTYTVGIGPYWVAAADVNGDGKADLIVANQGSFSTTPPYSSSTLMVLTNNGSGVFGSNASYSVGTRAVFVVAVDINGDGKLDLISANENANTLTMLTNNGSGIFGSNATYSVGNSTFSSPVFVVGTDVNGDGNVDLVCANNTDNTLEVLTNNGSGIFGSNATYRVGTSPFSIAATDVNGDGKVDLISANYFAGTLTVLTNSGNGVFGSNATYTVGEPRSVIAADIIGDGKLDLICSDGNALTVLTNDGNGRFTSFLTNTVSNGPQFVMAADGNGDGKLDLVTANFFGNTLSVLINTSTFPPPTSTPTLNINPSGKNMLVSWPSASAGWSLQQNPDLTTANWSPSGYSGYSIADDGTNKSLTFPSYAGNLFFRLLHP